MANAVSEITRGQNLLNELCYHILQMPTIFSDDIKINKNLVFHMNMKHITVDFNHLCNNMNFDRVIFKYFASMDQVVEPLTKQLPKPTFL